MNEIILRKIGEKIPSTKDTGASPSTLVNMMEYFPQVIDIFKEMNEGRRIESQYKLAAQEIERRTNSWNRVVDARVNERARCQDSVRRNIDATQDINEKLALYDKWIEIINSPFVTPEEI